MQHIGYGNRIKIFCCFKWTSLLLFMQSNGTGSVGYCINCL